jgi:putative SOS response-associated peptidase YedK
MCGRYALTSPAQAIAETFGVVGDLGELDATPRYNVAPGQDVWVVRAEGEAAERRLARVRWGLAPAWAEKAPPAATMINARAETAAEKPAFRLPYRRRRCIVPADGFYEWRRWSSGSQPFLIGLREGGPFAMAGLWDRWRGPDGARLESCTILTTSPNDLVGALHDRMPVILAPDDFDLWLDPRVEDVAKLVKVLGTMPSERMRAHPVSPRVNDPRNDDADCLTEVAPRSDPQGWLF